MEDRRLLAVTPFRLVAGVDSAGEGFDLASVARQAALIDFRGADLKGKDGPLADIGFNLDLLFHEQRLHRTFGAGTAFEPSNSALQVLDGRVVVDVIASGNPENLRQDLQGLGMDIRATEGKLISGLLPISALDDMAALGGVDFAKPVYRPITRAGAVESEGDAALNSDDAREVFGVDGTGITIGVLSDSFDNGGTGSAADDIASGDLPEDINVLSDSVAGVDEGRAMLQIIHDVAPGADLAFHTAGFSSAEFATGIKDLANVAGADVIVEDIGFLTEPFFQDGIVAQAADSVVASGTAFFSAAGNDGTKSYESGFVDSAVNGPLGGGPLHDFDPGPGVDTRQQFTLPVGGVTQLSFQWDQPFASVPGSMSGSASDLDLIVYGSDGTTVLQSEITRNIGADPLEVLSFFNDGTFDFDGDLVPDETFSLGIELVSGPAPGLMKYINFGDIQTVDEFFTNSSTLFAQPNAAGAAAVGASDFLRTPSRGVDPPVLEDFSSPGGTPILFNVDGTRLPEAEIRSQPVITGPDGVSTTLPDFNPFFGTSAAAPHVAAVAALVLEEAGGPGSLLPQEVYDTLQNTAVDILQVAVPGSPGGTAPIADGEGFDFSSGFGLVDALAAVEASNLGGDLGGMPKAEPAPPTEIAGVKWLDANGNGVRDEGEPGIEGVVIFIDSNDDGDINIGERAAVTDKDGNYRIRNVFGDVADGAVLEPVEVVVREVEMPGLVQTFPADDGAHRIMMMLGDIVEDIDFGNQVAVDYGDAPASYSTLAADDGPSHGIVPSFRLGALIDGEPDGIPDPDARGDDLTGVPDEDGVEFTSGLIFGELAEITVTASTDIGFLQGWIDFNADGDFADPGEQVVTDRLLSSGENTIFIQIPPAGAGQEGNAKTFARFRYGIEQGISFTGPARLGEVEDYAVTIQLPPPPGLTANDDSKVVSEDSVDNSLNVLANDTLIGGSGMKLVTGVTLPDQGGTVKIASDGKSLLYTPAPDFFGTETFTYTASDGVDQIDTATVTVDVVNVNDDPVAVDDSFTVGRNTSDNALSVLANDSFLPDPVETLTIDAVGSPDNGGAVVISSGGTGLLYTPAPGFSGTETFTYTIGDGNGGSDEATVSIEVSTAPILVDFRLEATSLDGTPVSRVNVGEQFLLRGFVEDVRDVPVGVFAAYLDVLYDSAFVSVDGDITFGASFENGRSGITSTAGVLDEVGAFDGFSPLGPGEFQLFEVPFSADAVGNFTFTSDPADVVPRHAVLLSDNADVAVANDNIRFGTTSIEIVEFGAQDDDLTVLEESVSNELDVLANDIAGTTGTLAITGVGATSGGGVVNIAGDGKSLLYTPAADFLGLETFTYTVANSASGEESTATVRVEVAPLAFPRARDDMFISDSAVTEDTANNPLDVLANDIVTPGGTLEIVSPVATILTSNGGRVTNDGGTRLLYTPADDFFGTDTFTYTIDDEFGDPSQATVTVEVVNVNDPPTAGDDLFDVAGDSTLNVLDVLANDTFLPDPAETLTIIGVGTPDGGGTVTIDGGNQLLYTPLAGFVGTETFTYTINDGQPLSDATATVSVDVGLEDLVRIRLHTTDTLGQPISSIQTGQDFQLHASVQDLRGLPVDQGGVFSAYLDVLFDAGFVSVVEDAGNPLGFDIEFGDGGATYTNGQKGSIDTPGLIDEVGAFDGFDPLGPDEAMLLTVTFHADQAGQFNFQGDFAEDPNSEVLLFDFDSTVTAGRIDFGPPLPFEVIDAAPMFNNQLQPTDVNADGRVTPLDALLVINALNRQGGQRLAAAFAANTVPEFFPDVNSDGRLSPLDALLIINELNARVASSTRLESEGLVVATADGVSQGLSTEVGVGRRALPPEQTVVSDLAPTTHKTLLVEVPDFKPTTNNPGDDYLENDSEAMVATDRVLEETFTYLNEDGETAENLLATDHSTADGGGAATLELDPVLSDIAEDIAIAWLK